MPNITGRSLGRYHIIEKLGEGGMATVYRAYDTRLEREVAIKVIRNAAFPPDQVERMFKRFEREARALARLSHQNIVKVLDYGEYEGAPYLVMEYLPGGTLKDRLTKGRIPWQDAMQLLKPIAQALAHAHENQIVHRDIKPSNILIARSGDPMLSDFGIAKILENEDLTELTSTGTGVGTPEYMAPEQGMGKADERADVYALGVVLYQMITGQVPFRADTPLAVLIKKNTDPLPRPTKFVPDLPAGVEYLLIKALERDPNQRYQSMARFISTLDKVLESKGLIGRMSEPLSDRPTEDIQVRDVKSTKNGKNGKKSWMPWIVMGGLLVICCGMAGAAFLAQQVLAQNPILIPQTTVTLPVQPPLILPSPTNFAQTIAEPSTVTPIPPLIPTTLTLTATPSPVAISQNLAFVSDRNNGFARMRVHIIDTEHPNEYQVFDNPSGYESAEWPSFCGTRLAAEVIDKEGANPQWIYLFNTDGSSTKWAVNGEALGVPRCSPDGQYIAYSAQIGNYWDLMLASLSNGKLIDKLKAQNYGKIAGYASWDAASQSFILEVISSNVDIVLLRVDRFPSSPSLKQFELGRNAKFVSLSPDGRQAAFECDEGQLCVTNLDSEKTQTLYQTHSDVSLGWTESVTPVWSTNGQWIYFASVDGGDWDIFRIHPDGSGVENVTRDWPSNEIHPAIKW